MPVDNLLPGEGVLLSLHGRRSEAPTTGAGGRATTHREGGQACAVEHAASSVGFLFSPSQMRDGPALTATLPDAEAVSKACPR